MMNSENTSLNTTTTHSVLSQTPPNPHSRKSIEKKLLGFLITQFPDAFFEKERRPLKIGIAEDILRWFEVNPNQQIVVNSVLLTSVLGSYTSNPRYLISLQVDAIRLDLNGQPVGKVTIEEAEHAKNKFEALHHLLSAKYLKKKSTAKAEALKRAEASRQKIEKVVKKKQILPGQSNPGSKLPVLPMPTSEQPSSGKLQPIIRFIRKRFHAPSDEK